MSETRSITVTLTRSELLLITEAIESYVYWQLSEPEFRRDCVVVGEGSTDPEQRAEIQRAVAIVARLERALGEPIAPPIDQSEISVR